MVDQYGNRLQQLDQYYARLEDERSLVFEFGVHCLRSIVLSPSVIGNLSEGNARKVREADNRLVNNHAGTSDDIMCLFNLFKPLKEKYSRVVKSTAERTFTSIVKEGLTYVPALYTYNSVSPLVVSERILTYDEDTQFFSTVTDAVNQLSAEMENILQTKEEIASAARRRDEIYRRIGTSESEIHSTELEMVELCNQRARYRTLLKYSAGKAYVRWQPEVSRKVDSFRFDWIAFSERCTRVQKFTPDIRLHREIDALFEDHDPGYQAISIPGNAKLRPYIEETRDYGVCKKQCDQILTDINELVPLALILSGLRSAVEAKFKQKRKTFGVDEAIAETSRLSLIVKENKARLRGLKRERQQLDDERAAAEYDLHESVAQADRYLAELQGRFKQVP